MDGSIVSKTTSNLFKLIFGLFLILNSLIVYSVFVHIFTSLNNGANFASYLFTLSSVLYIIHIMLFLFMGYGLAYNDIKKQKIKQWLFVMKDAGLVKTAQATEDQIDEEQFQRIEARAKEAAWGSINEFLLFLGGASVIYFLLVAISVFVINGHQ